MNIFTYFLTLVTYCEIVGKKESMLLIDLLLMVNCLKILALNSSVLTLKIGY